MTLYPVLYQTASGTPRDLGSLISMESQGFGADVPYYSDPKVWPHPTNGHPGIDWPCHIGTPLYAPCDGTVSQLATDFRVGAGFGAGVILDPGDGSEIMLWHFSRIDVSLGQKVARGQQVGLSGNSGVTSGPHVHLEYRPAPIQVGNGFWGAVDPTPYMVWDVLPQATDVMTHDEVVKVYVLAFYREPTADEAAYWTGKPLLLFLNTAIKDRSLFLQSHE